MTNTPARPLWPCAPTGAANCDRHCRGDPVRQRRVPARQIHQGHQAQGPVVLSSRAFLGGFTPIRPTTRALPAVVRVCAGGKKRERREAQTLVCKHHLCQFGGNAFTLFAAASSGFKCGEGLSLSVATSTTSSSSMLSQLASLSPPSSDTPPVPETVAGPGPTCAPPPAAVSLALAAGWVDSASPASVDPSSVAAQVKNCVCTY